MLFKRLMSILHTILLAAVMAAGICGNVAAEPADWKPYAADKHFSYYFDANSLAYPHKSVHNVLNLELADVGIVRVKSKSVMKDEKGRELRVNEIKKSGLAVKGYDSYFYTVSLREVNCAAKKYRSFSEADYTKEGTQIGSSVEGPDATVWEPIPAGSEIQALQGSVCRR